MGDDRQAIAGFFERVCDTWAANDGEALGRLFTADGSLINPFGQRADGRAAVGAMYAEYFDGMLKGTSTTFELTNVRSVDDTHAFADGEQTILGPDGSVVLVVHLAALLQRQAGGWLFVDSRPYAIAAPPA